MCIRDRNNIDNNETTWIELIGIYTTPDKADAWTGNLIITNISWKKTFSTLWDSAYLFFESNGTENFLEITTN